MELHPHPAAPSTRPDSVTPANLSFGKQNSHSLIAMGVAAAYVLIAMTAHIVFVGIIPVMLSIRAFKATGAAGPGRAHCGDHRRRLRVRRSALIGSLRSALTGSLRSALTGVPPARAGRRAAAHGLMVGQV